MNDWWRQWDSQNKILNGTYINFTSKKGYGMPSKWNGMPSEPKPSDTNIIATLGSLVLGKAILGV